MSTFTIPTDPLPNAPTEGPLSGIPWRAAPDASKFRKFQNQHQTSKADVRASRDVVKGTCARCMKAEDDELKLKQCAKCQAVRYCSKECQKADWPAHKHACKLDSSSISVNKIGSALLASDFLNDKLQRCFISAFKMTTIPRSRLFTEMFVGVADVADVAIEPSTATDFFNLTIAMRDELTSAASDPTAGRRSRSRCTTSPRRPVPEGGIEVWKRMRTILDEQGHRDWAVGLLAVAKTHAPKLVALLPVPISRARITRHATVDTMLEAMNEHLKHDAKRNTLG
ncbi:hypothetical protein HMN09_00662500 [Mycena chlorophos]|uniref:MYND-type domain-containing protein n=1 Tax=Mycena chlorophos TaxID=658473 RepID=A0A8H6WB00_MYCCL|nr:hypothetical protein HMN09_00662500 [Mycena chlorophos]